MHDKKSVKYRKFIKEATKKVQTSEYKDAYDLIMKAIYENPNAPETHNLLGIWYEFEGDKALARKHYRIAYVLDPVYKPAIINLERVSTLYLNKKIEVAYYDKHEKESYNNSEYVDDANEIEQEELD